MHGPRCRIAHLKQSPPTVTDDLDIHPSFVPLAAVQALSLLASAVAGWQQGAVQQQPLTGFGLGHAGHPLVCGPCDQSAQPGDDAGDGRLADPWKTPSSACDRLWRSQTRVIVTAAARSSVRWRPRGGCQVPTWSATRSMSRSSCSCERPVIDLACNSPSRGEHGQ